MGRKRYTPEQNIGKLRQAEVRAAEGSRVVEIVRELGITELCPCVLLDASTGFYDAIEAPAW